MKKNNIHFSLLIYTNNLSSDSFEYSNIHDQKAVTVYAAFGICHSENILKYNFKI